MKSQLRLTSEYSTFLGELKKRITSARVSAGRAVNSELILLYWDIGRGIIEKQKKLGWGESVVEMLAHDLGQAFPDSTGFSTANVWRMRQFVSIYSKKEFLAQLVRELRFKPAKMTKAQILTRVVPGLLESVPWGHHVELMNKVKDPEQCLYYLRADARFGWSRNVLLNQIKADAYGRSLKEGKAHNFPTALPTHLAEQAEETLKSSYNLEFLGIARSVKERELEGRLVEQLRDFILELGYGFCFIGQQHRLTLGKKEYFIDLLFYHRFLKALVAIELKSGPFHPEYAGKMDFYLNVLNDRERSSGENPSIGIILCAEKDGLEVEFALKAKTNPIGVAEYRLQHELPSELRGKLPSGKQLAEAIRKGRLN